MDALGFSIYDILTKLVPGSLLYFSFWAFFATHISGQAVSSIDKVPAVLAAFFIYLVGYFNDALSRIGEPLLFRTFGGNPAVRLQEGKTFSRIRLWELERIKRYLFEEDATLNDGNGKIADPEKAFGLMYRYVSNLQNKRVESFSNTYYLSRNLLPAILLSAVLLVMSFYEKIHFDNPYHLLLFAGVLGLLLLDWFFAKQRNWFFCKEVMNVFLSGKIKEEKEMPANRKA